MSGSSPILGLFLPGGGSQNKYGAADVVDIDKINDNFSRIDSSLGVIVTPDNQLPSNPYLWQVVHASTTDSWVTWNGSNWIGALPARLSSSGMSALYFTQSNLLNDGKLDSRYFTQDQLLNQGKLDSRYPNRGATGVINQAMLTFKVAVGQVTVTANTADSDSGHNGFSGTASFIVGGMTSITANAVVLTPTRSSSFEIHWAVKSVVGLVVTIYYWSSNSNTATFNWQAIGS